MTPITPCNGMRKRRRRILITLLAAFLLWGLRDVNAQAGVRVVDAVGRSVEIAKPAKRIIALAPHIVENLYAIGAGERVVGAVEYSDYPAAAKAIPRVGGVGSISLEKIVALNPDLVILWASGAPIGFLEGLDRLRMPYYVDEIQSLNALRNSLAALGSLTGEREKATEAYDKVSNAMRERQSELTARGAKALSAPRVFVQVWDKPLQSIGKNHFLNEVIELCGGQSISAAAQGLAPMMSLAYVIATDPDLIIAESEAQAAMWHRYSQMRAVQTANIKVVDPDLLYRPTLRLLAGMSTLCELISKAPSQHP